MNEHMILLCMQLMIWYMIQQQISYDTAWIQLSCLFSRIHGSLASWLVGVSCVSPYSYE